MALASYGAGATETGNGKSEIWRSWLRHNDEQNQCGSGLSGAATGAGGGWGVGGPEFGGFFDGGRLGFERRGAVLLDEGGDGVFQGLDAFAGDGGDGEERQLAALGKGGELFELVGVGDVGFGGDEDGGLGGEGGVEGLELGGDDLEVGDGVGAGGAFGGAGVGDVDEVDDDGGALDVFEELDAEAVAEVRAFDEAGKVGYGEGEFVGEVADLDDAEVGLEGGEGVVGDLGPGGGEARDEGGFADVGVADEAGVGE